MRRWRWWARLAAHGRRARRIAARCGDPVWRALAHGLGHDLRGPPTDVLALAGLYRAGALSAPAFAAQVAVHAREALTRIDELTCLIEEAVHVYRFDAVDLTALVAQCVDAAWTTASEAGVRVLSAGSPPRAWVDGDARMLELALSSLLVRAICGTASGATLRVRVGEGRGLGKPRCCVEVVSTVVAPAAAAALSCTAPAGMFVRRVLRCHGGRLTLQHAAALTVWRLTLPKKQESTRRCFPACRP